MASKLQMIPQFAGIRDLRALTDFLDDRERYDALIADIETKWNRANKLIEKLGIAQGIDNARRQAAQLMDDAKKEGERIKANEKMALTTLRARNKTLEHELAEFEEAKREADRKMGLREGYAREREIAANELMEKADVKLTEARKQSDESDAVRVEYEALSARLEEAMK